MRVRARLTSFTAIAAAIAVLAPTAPASAVPSVTEAQVARSVIVTYDPPVRIRSDRAKSDARALEGAGARLVRFLPKYVETARRKEAAHLASALPSSCFARMELQVERVRADGWAVVSQRLLNADSCAFDGAQRVVLKASARGRGRVVARLGSGGMPDCAALAASGVPAGLVAGC